MTTLNREGLGNTIHGDLGLRNQNWETVETHLAETATIVRIKQNVTVLQTGWVDDTAMSGYWIYDVTDTDITADMAVDVYIHLTSLDDATMVLPVNQSATDKFTLYANSQPLANISIDYSILNQIGGV